MYSSIQYVVGEDTQIILQFGRSVHDCEPPRATRVSITVTLALASAVELGLVFCQVVASGECLDVWLGDDMVND